MTAAAVRATAAVVAAASGLSLLVMLGDVRSVRGWEI